VIRALAPLAELQDYSSRLKSLTGGEGSWSIELSHYEPVPARVQQELASRHKRHDDD
jgi:elongation factor G